MATATTGVGAGAGRTALRGAGEVAPASDAAGMFEVEGGGAAAGASMGFGREDGRRFVAFALRDDAGPDTVAVPETNVGPDETGDRVSTAEEDAGAPTPPAPAPPDEDEVDGRTALGAAAPPITRVFMLVSFLLGSGPVVRSGSVLFAAVEFVGAGAGFAPRLGSVASPSTRAGPGADADELRGGALPCEPSAIGGAAGRW
ncbi:hypothetical protein LZC95_42735 [Pendulispora brunnea]|uniref:Uncharacterized protein n=1 Tax=Pendulispora brunnea TaxID=2905690 RepID=A0ABZ2K7A7_9BACT